MAKLHTKQHINDSHRVRFFWGKCGECLTITERAYCLDDQEFMIDCQCGGSAENSVRVNVTVA